jgi:hypothetical protein
MQQQQMPQDIQSIQQQPLQQQQSMQQQQLQQPGLQSQSQQGFWPPQQQQFTMPTYGGQPQLGIGQQPQWSPFDVQARQLDDLSALMRHRQRWFWQKAGFAQGARRKPASRKGPKMVYNGLKPVYSLQK